MLATLPCRHGKIVALIMEALGISNNKQRIAQLKYHLGWQKHSRIKCFYPILCSV